MAVCVMALPMVAAAQDFGVMNSAETINKGNFKLAGNPIVVFGKGNADNEVGVALSGGYGFGDRFDVEAKLGFFDNLTLFGADAEYWMVKGQQVNVSAIGGFHVSRNDFEDTKALDLTLLASGEVAPRLELFGALDFARISIDNANFTYNTLHFVPGIEYRVSSKVDFVTEVGIALNDNSSHYITAGFAFYIRPR
jgi:hypothetical protein